MNCPHCHLPVKEERAAHASHWRVFCDAPTCSTRPATAWCLDADEARQNFQDYIDWIDYGGLSSLGCVYRPAPPTPDHNYVPWHYRESTNWRGRASYHCKWPRLRSRPLPVPEPAEEPAEEPAREVWIDWLPGDPCDWRAARFEYAWEHLAARQRLKFHA